MKHPKPHYGRWLPWTTGMLAFAGLAGTLWALSEVLETDTDGDGWTDAEEIIAGTDPADETDPWDSDGDGIADYLEFLDGTDPLDPNDPPQARGASAAYSVAATVNEATGSGDDSSANTTTPIFPALEEASRKSMYHATAWYNGRVDLAFITPTATSKWQAAVGTELEYWNVGYYDLLARNNSKGIAITLNAPPAREYALCWKHMKRPDGGETAYTVSIKIGEEVLVSQSFTAPERSQAEGGEDVSLNFTLPQDSLDNVTIVFMPTGTSTSGPLVGSIELKNPNLSLAAKTVRGIYEGPYEIERTTITLSGNVANGLPKAFTLTKPFEISEGNLVEISVVSDDAASVTIAPLELAVSSDGGTATGKSEWRASYNEDATIPVSVTYTNQGDTYNLSITIIVKRSLRVLDVMPVANTPRELEKNLSEEDLTEARQLRQKIGCSETLHVSVNHLKSRSAITASSICIDETPLFHNVSEANIPVKTLKNQVVIQAVFDDGEILCERFEIAFPKCEIEAEINRDEFISISEDGINPDDEITHREYTTCHYFMVKVLPDDVSFNGLYIWENDCIEEKDGILWTLSMAWIQNTNLPLLQF